MKEWYYQYDDINKGRLYFFCECSTVNTLDSYYNYIINAVDVKIQRFY